MLPFFISAGAALLLPFWIGVELERRLFGALERSRGCRFGAIATMGILGFAILGCAIRSLPVERPPHLPWIGAAVAACLFFSSWNAFRKSPAEYLFFLLV